MGAWKNLALQEYHQFLGAKMVPFCSWSVPQQYPGGAQGEHRHVRNECGLFDFSCTGAYQISGEGSAGTLDFLLTRKVSSWETGACRENCLLSEDGGILDLLHVCRMAEEDFFIIASPGCAGSDAAWFSARLPRGSALRELSDCLSHFSLQGPKAPCVLAEFSPGSGKLPSPGRCALLEIGGVRCIVCPSVWSGEPGFELFCDADRGPDLWETLLNVPPVRPTGFGAMESLRLEMGKPVCGSELSPRYTPFESALEEMVSLHQSRGDFLGRAALLKRKPGSFLTGVLLPGRNAARAGAAVFNAAGEKTGTVTSGAFCPTLGRSAALCRITGDKHLPEGGKLLLECGNSQEEGIVTALPFLKNRGYGEERS